MDSNSKSVRKRKDETEVKKQKDEITDRVSVRPGELPVKLFEDRKSVLTDLLENTQFASVHHICIALFVGACISSIVHDYLYNGKMRMGLNLVLKGFRNMHLMIMIWLLVFLLSCVPYFGVKYWAQVRSSLKRKSLQMYFWDRISLFLYIAHLFGMLYCGSSLLLKNEMGFTAGLSSIVETVRLMMKVYSFGRVCISRVLNEPEKYSKQHPTFSHYIYFFFAPTLLYKDSYPRSCEKIRWGKVALYFSELIGVIFFCSITFDRAFIAEFKDYGIKHISVIDIILTITNNAPYGMLFMFSLNYLLLHLWLNAFAEMLSFSDRLFYKDLTMDSNNKSIRKRKAETKVKKHKDEITDSVSVRPGELPEKLFEDRKSVLTELFENRHIASFHHVFIALFVCVCISSLVHDHVYNRKVRMGLNLVMNSFRNMHLMIMIWLTVFFLSFVPYFGVKYWAQVRSTLKRKSLQMYFWDRLSLFLYIVHLFGMLYCGSSLLLKYEMGFTAGLSSIVETVRLMMKVYSFGRVCISRVLNEPEKYSKQHPTFSHYIYFSFAPTLLYRDSYPRSSEKIRWGKVVVYFSEFIGIIFFCSITFDRAFIAEFKDYGLKHISVINILLVVTNNAHLRILFMFSQNYLLLHLWLNAFAEMLGFSDRLFYKDWWTSSTYDRYHRTWNTVVHDWLYTYIYKEFFEILAPKRKFIAKAAVFFVSSVFHDFVVSLAIGFYLPVFLINLFVFGEMIAYVKFPNNLIGNVFFLYTSGLGSSVILSAYTLEYFCRVNTATNNSSLRDFFIPKFVECYKQ